MSERRPNFLIFMTDQQLHSTLDADSPCPTPAVDRLMARGVRFTRAFTPSPVCTPARASFFTGLEIHQHRLTHVNHANYHMVDDLAEGVKTFADLLSAAGYRCGYSGKWHVSLNKPPTEHGFDEFKEPPRPAKDAPWPELTDRVEPPVMVMKGPGITPPAWKAPEMELAAVSSQTSDESKPFKIARAGIDMLRRYANEDQPFCLYVGTAAPHVPWIVPRDFAGRVDPEKVKLPESFDDDLADKPLPYRTHYNTFNFCPMNDREKAHRALVRYYEFVSLADAACGLVLDELDSLGLTEDTVVIFATDHGEMGGAHGLFGKDDTLTEELVRIPFVLSWPGRFEPAVRDEMVSHIDVFATVLELAGVGVKNPPPTSRSLVPLLEGKDDPERFPPEVVLQHFGNLDFNTVRGLRTDRWKYVWWASSIEELYDLEQDPGEMRNLAAKDEFRDTLLDLRSRLVARMAATKDNATKSAMMFFALDDWRYEKDHG